MKQSLYSLEFKMFNDKNRLLPRILKSSTMLGVVFCSLSAFANTDGFEPASLRGATNKIYYNFNLQQNQVKGTVTDSNGAPIPGANILEKGTTNGVQTDFDGNFVLSVSNNNAVLVVSYVGFTSREISVNGQTSINVQLQEDAARLEEVVVVGFGVQKKVNLTGSVATVSGEMLESRPITSVSAGLSGLLPGVAVNQSSGQPGSDGGSIRIRGTGTLNQASPMVLIDGVEGSLNDVQANDIASISVLKDAASAAIYGSKAANGVILITTKSGKSGEPVVSITSDVGWQSPTTLPEYLGSYDYATLYNEELGYMGEAPKFTANDIELFGNGSDPYGRRVQIGKICFIKVLDL